MIYRTAKELLNDKTVFVGIGLPLLSASLARATHAPDLLTVFESGVIGATPSRLPLSIADPAVVAGSLSVVSVSDIFQNYLQGGLIDIGLLRGGQIDRYGNINSTVLGDYNNPRDRLPGCGGACEIAIHVKRLIIIMPMTQLNFVEQCDFITSPGHYFNSKGKSSLEPSNSSPYLVVTNAGVCEFEDGEMILTEICPGETLESIKDSCGWPLKISNSLVTAETPPKHISHLLEKLDPQKSYL